MYNALKYRALSILIVMMAATMAMSQSYKISGRVIDAEQNEGVGFSYVMVSELSLWAVADANGDFLIQNVSAGDYTIQVNCMGYEKMARQITVDKDIVGLELKISQSSLKINDVVVVAQRKKSATSTSYNIDRMALDNQQVLNLSSVSSLLPGGKTVNDNLTDDNRISLRSESLEKGNASFGTAIEIDGVRMDNNAMMGETTSASTRTVATSDIESVDIITGIPSVEYGDLSNGVVKINLRRGKSPYVIECKINQSTSQHSINKGFELGGKGGVVNISFERAKSIREIASPYTSYKRNALSARYSNVFLRSTTPLSITLGVTGNIGGYNSEQDPDNNLDSYEKVDEKLLRVNGEANLLLNKLWITDLSFKGSVSIQDHLKEIYTNSSSSSSQPYLHTKETGYHVAGTSASDDIILGPTGYWYVREYVDQKPISANFSLKANCTKKGKKGMLSKILVGADVTMTGNNGRGKYYEDILLAPTWREFRYDEQPWMYNMAYYAEGQFTKTINSHSLSANIGLRDDMTYIPESAYKTLGSLSPRFSGRYEWKNTDKDAIIEIVSLHAGWGRSVKLPSFQVLFPQEEYSDILTFTPGSTADNKAYYAYYTYAGKPIYNENLKFQQTSQTDIGVEITLSKVKLSFSGYYNLTSNPYQMVNIISPLQYQFTSQSALEGIGIEGADRTYSVDRTTGVVTVKCNGQTITLPSTAHNTYIKNKQYVNASDVKRYGMEWIVDVEILKWLSMRLDGSFYHYRGVDETLIAGTPDGVGDYEANSARKPLVGYYRGSNTTSTGVVSTPSVCNGSETSKCQQNIALTVRVPKARLIVTLKAEATLLNKSRNLSEYGTSRGIALKNAGDVEGTPYNGDVNHYVALYPEYYSTWDQPGVKIPFTEAFANAKQNDPVLYQQLSSLIVRSNTSYFFNENKVSPYYSMNFLVTKEIGDHFSISMYANNFVNTMRSVHESQTGLDASLFNSKYVPKLYYGLSLKLKI